MENCLVTKLKGTVNNSDLKILGGFYINSVAGNGRFNPNLASTWKIVGNGHFSDSTYTQDLGKETTITLGNYFYFVAEEPIEIYCVDNYQIHSVNDGGSAVVSVQKQYLDPRTITTLSINELVGNFVEEGYFSGVNNGNIFLKSVVGVLDVKVFKGNTATRSIVNIRSSNVVGKTEDFALLNISDQIIFEGTNISGEIDVFGKYTDVTVIMVKNTKIDGSIEGLVETLWDNTKRDGNISLNVAESGVKLHNEIYNHGGITLAFSNSGATVSYGGSVVASYNGSTWTYA